MLESYSCLNCGESFERYPRRDREHKFCSLRCKCLYPPYREAKIQWGRSRKGISTTWSTGNYGATKGRKATGRQLEGLKIGWSRKGPDAPGWKGGVTAQYRIFRQSVAYRKWRKAVLERDKVCVECGASENLHADHIKPYCRFPELGLDVENGRALCRMCHMQTDTYAGRMLKWVPAEEVI